MKKLICGLTADAKKYNIGEAKMFMLFMIFAKCTNFLDEFHIAGKYSLDGCSIFDNSRSSCMQDLKAATGKSLESVRLIS